MLLFIWIVVVVNVVAATPDYHLPTACEPHRRQQRRSNSAAHLKSKSRCKNNLLLLLVLVLLYHFKILFYVYFLLLLLPNCCFVNVSLHLSKLFPRGLLNSMYSCVCVCVWQLMYVCVCMYIWMYLSLACFALILLPMMF